MIFGVYAVVIAKTFLLLTHRWVFQSIQLLWKVSRKGRQNHSWQYFAFGNWRIAVESSNPPMLTQDLAVILNWLGFAWPKHRIQQVLSQVEMPCKKIWNRQDAAILEASLYYQIYRIISYILYIYKYISINPLKPGACGPFWRWVHRVLEAGWTLTASLFACEKFVRLSWRRQLFVLLLCRINHEMKQDILKHFPARWFKISWSGMTLTTRAPSTWDRLGANGCAFSALHVLCLYDSWMLHLTGKLIQASQVWSYKRCR